MTVPEQSRFRRLCLVPLIPALALLAACGERELILPGERFDPRTPLDASIPVEGQPLPTDVPPPANISAPIALPAAQALADWPQRGGNVRHLAPHAALSAAPARVWSVGIGAGDSRRNRISAQPVVAGGRVFAMDALAQVTAVTTAGAPQWSASLAPPRDGTPVSGGGLAFGEGRLFATTGYGEVVAIDPASGAVIWRHRMNAAPGGAPAVANGTVFAVARDGSAFALRATDGMVQWRLPATPAPSGVIGAAAPALTGNAVILPFSSGQLVAADPASGNAFWAGAVAGDRLGRAFAVRTADITGDPVVSGDTIYVANQGGRTVALAAATGQRRWSAGEGAVSSVLPVGNAVFLVSDEARLVRLDAATGQTVWAVEMPYFLTDRPKRRKEITAHYGPVLAGGRLVVASGDGQVRFFNPTDGSPLGGVALPGGAAAAPAFAQGMMFIAGKNGQLHAFR